MRLRLSPIPMSDTRHHLFLLRELVKRDFQGRYAGSLLGFVWSFVQPLWMLLLFTFVFFRDTAQVLGMVFTAWFYLTPIVYPIGAVPPRYLPWIEANPLSALVGLYRQALLGAPASGGILALAAAAAVLLSAGLWLFA